MADEKMQRIREALDAGKESYYFLCNDVVHALAVVGLIADIAIISYDKSPLTDALRETGVKVHLLTDEFPRFDKLKTTNNLIAHEFVKGIISSDSNTKRLLIFKNSSIAEERANALSIRLLASEAKVSRWIENKVKFYEAIKKEGVKTVPGEIVTIDGHTGYAEFAKKYGDRFVLQAAKGFAGAKTYLINDEAGFDAIKDTYNKRSMRLTAFLTGATVTVNACATALGTLVKPPFYQLTGHSVLTVNEMGACGNSYDIHDLSAALIDEISSATKKIGDYIYQKGYKGLFGVDYIINDGHAHFIECNPRFVTSLPMFTTLELCNGEVPLIASHILENLGRIGEASDIIKDYEPGDKGYFGAQLNLHNLSGAEKRIKADLKCGVYKFHDGDISFVRSGYKIDDIEAGDEYLIIPKGYGVTVNSGMECARILTKKSVTKVAALDNRLVTLINRVYKELID